MKRRLLILCLASLLLLSGCVGREQETVEQGYGLVPLKLPVGESPAMAELGHMLMAGWRRRARRRR